MDTDYIAEFNQLYKETDALYHSFAKNYGISDSVMWIMYILYDNKGTFSQKELCSELSCPPQTVNSALKSMEKQGLIDLKLAYGSKKNKNIIFTAKGGALADKIIKPLVAAENKALMGLNIDERKMLLYLSKKYFENLRSEIEYVSSED